MAVVDYYTFGDPAMLDVTRTTRSSTCRMLAMTGSPLVDGLIWAALLALFAGVLLVHVTRRRRGEATRATLIQGG